MNTQTARFTVRVAALFCATCANARDVRFTSQRRSESMGRQQTAVSAPAETTAPTTAYVPAAPSISTVPRAPSVPVPAQPVRPSRTAPTLPSADTTTRRSEPENRTVRAAPQPQVATPAQPPSVPMRSTSPVTIDRVERPTSPVRFSGTRSQEATNVKRTYTPATVTAEPQVTRQPRRIEPVPSTQDRQTPTARQIHEARRTPDAANSGTPIRSYERRTPSPPASTETRQNIRPSYDTAVPARPPENKTATLHFSSSSARSRAVPETPPTAISLRTPRPDQPRDAGSRTATPSSPRHITAREPRRTAQPAASEDTARQRTTLYRAPDRSAYAPRPQPHHAQPVYPAPVHRHRPTYSFDPRTFTYQHHAFTPVWYSQSVYPASGFGFSWSSRSLGLSFYSHTPTYAYTRYYNSWHCGGLGYSSVYYGGWRSGWYGGFSYVYNPWPVYRTYYLHDPYPVVTRTETVYITQPATTTYIVQEQAPSVTTAVTQPPSLAATIPQERAEPSDGCFCACHCNNRQACTCDYPCGAEQAVVPEAFSLSLSYVSYAVTLNPETIWASYAGLDRWDSDVTVTEFAVSADH